MAIYVLGGDGACEDSLLIEQTVSDDDRVLEDPRMIAAIELRRMIKDSPVFEGGVDLILTEDGDVSLRVAVKCQAGDGLDIPMAVKIPVEFD